MGLFVSVPVLHLLTTATDLSEIFNLKVKPVIENINNMNFLIYFLVIYLAFLILNFFFLFVKYDSKAKELCDRKTYLPLDNRLIVGVPEKERAEKIKSIIKDDIFKDSIHSWVPIFLVNLTVFILVKSHYEHPTD